MKKRLLLVNQFKKIINTDYESDLKIFSKTAFKIICDEDYFLAVSKYENKYIIKKHNLINLDYIIYNKFIIINRSVLVNNELINKEKLSLFYFENMKEEIKDILSIDETIFNSFMIDEFNKILYVKNSTNRKNLLSIFNLLLNYLKI